MSFIGVGKHLICKKVHYSDFEHALLQVLVIKNLQATLRVSERSNTIMQALVQRKNRKKLMFQSMLNGLAASTKKIQSLHVKMIDVGMCSDIHFLLIRDCVMTMATTTKHYTFNFNRTRRKH